MRKTPKEAATQIIFDILALRKLDNQPSREILLGESRLGKNHLYINVVTNSFVSM